MNRQSLRDCALARLLRVSTKNADGERFVTAPQLELWIEGMRTLHPGLAEGLAAAYPPTTDPNRRYSVDTVMPKVVELLLAQVLLQVPA